MTVPCVLVAIVGWSLLIAIVVGLALAIAADDAAGERDE